MSDLFGTSGNDVFALEWLGYTPFTITTGAGRDTIRFTQAVDSLTTTVTIADFAPGEEGDVVDIMPFLDWYL